MAYRNDFYTDKNIIGYTGNLAFLSQVSIYFFDPIQRAFGHITQQHYMPQNIGRMVVSIDRDYLICNSKEGDPIVQSAAILDTPKMDISQVYLNKIIANCALDVGNSLVEFYCSDLRHISRNRFVHIPKHNHHERIMLSDRLRLQTNQHLKPRYKYLETIVPDYTDVLAEDF